MTPTLKGQLLTSILLFSFLAITAGRAVSASAMDRNELSALLRHQELLVKSAEARFHITWSATPPDVIDDIREVCRARGQGNDYGSFVVSAEMAKSLSYKAQWWRKGVKEREDRFVSDGHAAVPLRFKAFDGEFVRSVALKGNAGPIGQFDSVASSAWNESNRDTPFSHFEFFGLPISTVVAKSPRFDVSVLDNRSDLIEVTVAHPALQSNSIKLVLNGQNRIVRRDAYALGYSADPTESLMYQRIEFKDYRAHTDPSGESIWFPHLSTYRLYVGKLSDGTMVEYAREELVVDSIKLNVRIPDTTFVVNFPKNARVWDAVNGLGWIEAEKPSPVVRRPVLSVLLFGVIPLTGVVVLVWLGRRHTSRKG